MSFRFHLGWREYATEDEAKSRLLGGYFSADRQRLRQLARQRGVHTIDNVAASTG